MRKIKRVVSPSCRRIMDQNGDPLKRKRGRPKKLRNDLKDDQPKFQRIESSARNPNAILSLLINHNVVAEGAKVHYRPFRNCKNLTKGTITRYGIECDCCQNTLVLSEFEAHAGSTRHRPSENIILEDGRSLTDCQKELTGKSKKKRITRNPPVKNPERKNTVPGNDKVSDIICSFCYDGGDLVLCNQCPSAFHKTCVGLEEIPDRNWFCPFCCCKICGQNKLVNNHVQKAGFILRCDQCPQKFHVECARTAGLINLEKESKSATWFCSDKCKYVFSGLQQLVGKPVAVGEDKDNLTWTLLKPMGSDRFDPEDLSANNIKLHHALEVMHECFEPAKEAYTGKDIAEDVIFSRESNLHRLNFRRFYTIIIEKNNEPRTAASVRVSGDKVAEVPLVATKFQYQRQGLCRILVNELERQLLNLSVEKLVLPAALKTLKTWTKGFGFSVMTDSDRKALSDYPILVFGGTVLCQKFLREIPSA